MDFSNIENNSIIICPNSIKRNLIEEKTAKYPLLKAKFMDKGELFKGLFFDYDYEAIYEIHKAFDYPLDNAEEIIKNAYVLGDSSENMRIVKKAYEHLKERKLLHENTNFPKLFKGKKVYIYGYSSLDEELKYALSLLKAESINLTKSLKNTTRTIVSFENINDELTFVIDEIYKLLEKGVSLNNIYIYQPQDEYILNLNKLSMIFGLPIEFNESHRLYDSPVFKRFLDLLKEKDAKEAYDEISSLIKNDPYDAVGQIANCINETAFLSSNKDEFCSLLEHVAKRTNLKRIKYEESIKLCDSHLSPTDEDHIFVMNFSLGSFPLIAKDEDFYLDYEKKELHLNDSKTQSQINENDIIDFLNRSKNIVITRRRKNGKERFFDSLLKEKLGYKEIKGSLPDECFSLNYAELLVGKAIDLERFYGIDSRHVKTFCKEEIHYNSFDHKYKPIEKLDSKKKLVLSYSQIQEYNKCPFQYFLKRVVKLQAFDDTFSSKLGVLFHTIIEEGITKVQQPSDYEDEINDKFVTESEKHFIHKLLPQAFAVASINRRFHALTSFKNIKTEESKFFDIAEDVAITGKVDKALINDNEKLIAVVDYKTGSVKLDEKITHYGLGLQLPLYAFMLKHAYPDYQIAGLYIQNVLEDPFDKDPKDMYKLNGYTVNDINIVKKLDPEFGTKTNEEGELINTSEYIAAISLSKLGKLDKKRAKDSSFFDSLSADAEQGALLAARQIKNANFPIRPLVKDEMHDNPCLYCPCKDICLKKSSDAVSLSEYKEIYDSSREETEGKEELQ